MIDMPEQNEFYSDNNNEHDATGTVQIGAAAPSQHDAITMPLAEFSLTRDEVVLMYEVAGIKVKRRTVSRYAQEGLLRAEKVDAERGLKRYLFNKQSVEDDIQRRKRGPSPVYAAIYDDGEDSDDATAFDAAAASSRHSASTEQSRSASSHESGRERDLEIELAKAQARLEEKEIKHQEDITAIKELAKENGQLRISLGEYKGRNQELETQLLRLTAPSKTTDQKLDDDTVDDASQEPGTQPAPAQASPRRGWFGWRQ